MAATDTQWLHYFSYGSNMSSKRLLARVPSARKVGVGVLSHHELRFHKASHKDGTAKCDARETGNADHCIHGVVFLIDPAEKPYLDKVEGVGVGYEEKFVTVQLEDGSAVEAYTYYATSIDPALKPFCWYKEHVMIGAREHALPADYVAQIECIEVLDDEDLQRREMELAIYGSGNKKQATGNS